MSRTELQLLQGPNGQVMALLRNAPMALPANAQVHFLGCDSTTPEIMLLTTAQPPAGAVRGAGSKLFQALWQNPDIQAALTNLLGAPAADRRPLYLIVKSDEADSLPWEALFEATGGFLTLDQRWPIVRVADAGGEVPPDRVFIPPLRIALVLGAKNEDALPQWEALAEALRGLKVAVEVRVWAAQDEVVNVVRDVGDPRFHAQPIQDALALLSELRQFAPHVLHFFCHGESTKLGTHLLVASRSIYYAQGGPLGFVLEGRDLQGRGELLPDLWLVSLMACRGAATPEAGIALTRSLAIGGVPSVIGMREIVAVPDGHEFSRGFFTALVRLLDQRLRNPNAVEIEWAEVLRDARSQILAQRAPAIAAQQAAADLKQWSLPVIYERLAPFRVRPTVLAPGMSTENAEGLGLQLRLLEKVKSDLDEDPQSSPKLRKRISDQIGNIQAQLRPMPALAE